MKNVETDRLRLLIPDRDCIELYEKFYTNGNASESYGGPLNVDQTWARLKADLGSWHLLGFGVWVLQSKETNELLGTCGFWQGRNWPTELTWWVLPEHRGQGYAFEASKTVIKHARTWLGWSKVETYMNDENNAARGLVLKLGGEINRRITFPDGICRDIYTLP